MQINTHTRFDTLKVVRYHQGTCYPIYSQIEASFTSRVRKTKTWLQKKLYYRFNPIRVLTQNMKLWQMIAYRQVFNLKEIFCYWSTPGPEKNCKGQFYPKANYFANPSFLKVGRNGDPTSNCSEPIRVLTRMECSCSDERLPTSFLLRDFQLI